MLHRLSPIRIDKELERKFKVRRDATGGISSVECRCEDIKECFSYVQEYGFFPSNVKVKISEVILTLCRDGYTGMVFVSGGKIRKGKKYPQQFTDKRIFKEVKKIISNEQI